MAIHQPTKRYKSTLFRIELIKKITAENYEPGNQSKCYAAIWRSKIFPQFGICYDTYLHYINFDDTP